MSVFHWDECFATRLAEVDEQHHRLVELINDFGALTLRGKAAAPEEFDTLFLHIQAYAHQHFRDEENLMLAHRLDTRHRIFHASEHTKFLDEIRRTQEFAAKDYASRANSLFSFLVHWLIYHILGVDHIMARQAFAIMAGQAPEQAFLELRIHQDPVTATLLRAIDGLYEQMSGLNHALLDMTHSLEEQVRQRTADLALANSRLEQIAMTDALTGLANRRQLSFWFERCWADSAARAEPLCCMMIDVDGFKEVNDLLGHEAGDQVLVALSRRLREMLRTDDYVGRLGGDEFLVICPRTPLAGALQLAETLRRQIDALVIRAGTGEWHGSISIGVAERQPLMACIEDLMREADESVYMAKHAGRNCVRSRQGQPALA